MNKQSISNPFIVNPSQKLPKPFHSHYFIINSHQNLILKPLLYSLNRVYSADKNSQMIHNCKNRQSIKSRSLYLQVWMKMLTVQARIFCQSTLIRIALVKNSGFQFRSQIQISCTWLIQGISSKSRNRINLRHLASIFIEILV